MRVLHARRLGSPLSLLSAVVLSGVGTGVGLWAAAWLIREYF
ncbi:MAG: hypothetical protein ABR527_00680 [Gemmatimonadota bacterium]